MKWLTACGAAAILSSCATTSVATTPAATSAAPSVARTDHADWQTDHDDPLADRMRGFATRLAGYNWLPTNEQARGFLVVGNGVTLPVDVPSGECRAWTIIGTAGIRDIDTTLFVPNGDLLAEDVEEDAHPTVVACANETPLHFYVVARAYAGAGAYLMASFQGAPSSLSAVAQALGGKPGIAGADEAETIVDARIRELAEGISRRGFTQAPDEAYHVRVDEHQSVRSPLVVRAGRCYTAGAFADRSQHDLNLRVLDAEAREVARESSASADSILQFCPENAGNWALEITSNSGNGEAAVEIFSGTEEAVGGNGGLWLGVRDRDVAASSDDAISGERSRLAAGGVVEKNITQLSACDVVTAQPGRGLGRLRIEARRTDSNALEVAEAQDATTAARLRICAPARTRWTVVIVAQLGEGVIGFKHEADH